jgi:hypothetical protein
MKYVELHSQELTIVLATLSLLSWQSPGHADIVTHIWSRLTPFGEQAVA